MIPPEIKELLLQLKGQIETHEKAGEDSHACRLVIRANNVVQPHLQTPQDCLDALPLMAPGINSYRVRCRLYELDPQLAKANR